MVDSTDKDSRKHDFLRTALDLFYEKGYESTKITDICKEMNVTKGAFYYYFESKEAVLVAIAEDFTGRAVSIIKSILNQTELSAVDKMNKVFKSINELKFREKDWRSKFKTTIKSGENLKLQNKLIDTMKQDGIRLLKELIDAGVEEGEFGHPVNSEELADFFLNTIFSLNMAVDDLENELNNNERDYQEILNKIEQKAHFYEVVFERVFQVREGSFDLRTPYMIKIKGVY